MPDKSGIIFNVERYTLHDGPGIRTTVFLKGCDLRCIWCCNPESQLLRTEIAYFKDKCTACENCLKECPQGAIKQEQPGRPVRILFDRCDGCGNCVETCYPEAIVMIGRTISARKVVDIAARDSIFYTRSGGGVTLSGGEPLLQAEYAEEILRLCRLKNIHTAIQTSGYGERSDFDLLLPYLDLIIFDIKHFDPAEHLKLTGIDNKKILDNLAYLDAKLESNEAKLVIQVPLIPGYNDSDSHLKKIFALARELRSAKGISLLPYHRFGMAKYARLGRDYSLSELPAPKNEYLKAKKNWAEQFRVPLISFNG